MADALYLIVDLDRTRVSESVVFWRADSGGYTVDFDDAGHYPEAEAKRIADNRDKNNIAIPLDAVPEIAITRVMQKSMIIKTQLLASALEAVPHV